MLQYFLIFLLLAIEANGMFNPNPLTGSHGPIGFWLNEVFSDEYRWIRDRSWKRPEYMKHWSDAKIDEYRRESYRTSKRYFREYPSYVLAALAVGVVLILFKDLITGTSMLAGEIPRRFFGWTALGGLPNPKHHRVRILGTPYLFEYEIQYPHLITRDQKFDLKHSDVLSRSPTILELKNGTRLEFVPYDPNQTAGHTISRH